MSCYDDDFDDDDDVDLEFFNGQPGLATVRLTRSGLNLTPTGNQTMVQTPITTFETQSRSLDQQLADIANRVVAKVGERMSTFPTTAPKAEPVKFKDGTPLASDLTPAEAKALGDNLPLIGEYVNGIEAFQYVGVSFETFATDKLLNDPDGEKIPVSPELFSAIEKQSREFTNTQMGIT